MRVFKLILTFFTLGYFIFCQDTPVNLESDAVSHNEIQLSWNVWDPSDSYYDAIIYISNIQEFNNETVIMDFYIENSVQISSFELSIQSDIVLSDISFSDGLTESYGWSLESENLQGGNFSIAGSNNGDIIPSISGTLFQLTANYSDQIEKSDLTLNYVLSNFENSFDSQLAFRWKNVIWEIGSGIADDECGDYLCTINENYSICPQECKLNVNYKVSRINPSLLITETSDNALLIDNSFNGINMVPLNEYCFEVEAVEVDSGVNEVSNIACSSTLCIETNYCQDLDGDGLGNLSVVIPSCLPIAGFVDNCTDENDNIYCLSNYFDFCGECNGTSICNSGSNTPGWCQCPDGQDEACWADNEGHNFDCFGTCYGTASEDDCGICTGGNTFLDFNQSQDCNGTCEPNDPFSLENCNGITGFNPSQPSTEEDCLAYLGSGGGVDQCGICGGNNSACFPYFDGPTNLLAQASNLQIGLSWDPVNLCDPYIYECDWGVEVVNSEPPNINNFTRLNEAFLDANISINEIEDDGQGTVSFYLSIQADIDIYFARINLDVYDIYDTLSVFQDFPNLEDLSENGNDCFNGNQNCIQFGQPSAGILGNEDYDFSAYTESNGSATLQSFSGDYIDSEVLQEGTTLFKMDAVYDPNTLNGKELYISHTLTIQSESDSLYLLKENYEKANVRFNTSVWQVGFGLASIYSCGDGICQKPFEEPGDDFLSPSLDTDENSEYYGQIVPDGYPEACSTSLTEYFLGIGTEGDCIPPQYCGDGICQDDNYCELVNGVLECGYTDGAPHESIYENWGWCSMDCYSCGNGVCDWSNYENFCDDDPNNNVPECSVNPIQYLSCSNESYYSNIADGVYGDCMEPFDVEYTIYRDNSNIISENSCIAINGIWEGQCYTPLITTTNTQYTDVGLNYLENHCYFIKASQGELTTMNGMIDPDIGNLNTNINGNSNISCDQTNPQIGELPVIRNIEDMPFDQGGYVKLTVQRSYSDNGTVDSLYQVFRKFESDTWTHVGSFPGTGEENYYFISPTLADSVPNVPNYHHFKVYYRGYLDSSAFSNFPEYGYSIDNIAPQTPSGLSTELSIDEIILDWNPVLEEDFSHYVIYRNGYEVDLSSTHSYVDHNYTEDGGFNFGELLQYQVGAIDDHGNISILSSVQMESYGNIGNVTFQDLFLDGQNNLGGEIVDSNLVDILDLTMVQSIACNQNIGCTDDYLINPTDYELWASNLNFDSSINVQDLTCLVYYIQNDIICPANNIFILSNFNYHQNTIIFDVQDIHSFIIELNDKTKLLGHNLSSNWKFIHGQNKIYVYSIAPSEFSGKIQLEFKNPENVKSIKINSYK